jgi:tetratricopeptide (TPR) repeat protein
MELARAAGVSAMEKHAASLLFSARAHGETPLSQLEREVVPPPVAGLDVRPILAATLALQGRMDEARRISADYVEDLRARGQIVTALTNAQGMAWFESLAGDVAAAEAMLREAWLGLGEVGERGFRSTTGGLFADVLARQGKLDEAAAVVDEALAISTPDDFVTVEAAEAARAWICLGRGEHDRAVEHARRATEIADSHEYVSVKMDAWLELGEILLATGRREEAESALAHAREIAARKGSTLHVDRNDALLGARPATR